MPPFSSFGTRNLTDDHHARLLGPARSTPAGMPPPVVEVRAADLPLRIITAGVYRLVEDARLESPDATAITIDADDVTVDLNRRELRGPGGGRGSGCGVAAGRAKRRGVCVKNGFIADFGGHGVHLADAEQSRVVAVRVNANGLHGVFVGGRVVVMECLAEGNGQAGVAAFSGARVHGCVAVGNGGPGFIASRGARVIDCDARDNVDFRPASAA